MSHVVRKFSLLLCASIFAIVGARGGEAMEVEAAAEAEPAFSTFDGIRLGVRFCYLKMLKEAAIAGGAVGIVAAAASFLPSLPGPFRKFKAAAWLAAGSSLLSLAYNCWNERFLMARGKNDIKGKRNVIISKDVDTLQEMIEGSEEEPNRTLRIVTFQDGSILQTVSQQAFQYCSALTEVVLPENVTEIEEDAFLSCRALQKVNIPENVVKIGARAFCSCCTLREISIGGNGTEIGQYAFCDCTSLKTIFLQEGVRSLGAGVFSWCITLERVTVPGSVENIERSAFSACLALKSVTLKEEIRQIEEYTFDSCSALEEIILPNSIEVIAKGIFSHDTALKEFVVGNNIRNIEDSTFFHTGLQNLDLTRCNIEEDREHFLNRIFNNDTSYISPSNEGCVATFPGNDKWVLRDAANKTWEHLAPPEEVA
jgi:hypothetical protein